MSNSYKFPVCMIDVLETQLDGSQKKITSDMVNPNCHCFNVVQAHFCMEGHMTECHAGMTCEEADCSHYEADNEYYPDQPYPDEKGGENV